MADEGLLARLGEVLAAELPITQSLGIRVESRSGGGLVLWLPLAANRNHKGAVFAGSLNAVATLAGWGALWLALGPAMGWAAGRRSTGLGVPVAAYAGVLLAMFATTTTLDPALPARARTSIRAGSALFLLSDTLLGAQDFLLSEHRPVLDRSVMATYTAGQGLIAWGVAHAR